MQDFENLLNEFKASDLGSCTATRALSHPDIPTVCVGDLFDDTESEPDPIFAAILSLTSFVLVLRPSTLPSVSSIFSFFFIFTQLVSPAVAVATV